MLQWQIELTTLLDYFVCDVSEVYDLSFLLFHILLLKQVHQSGYHRGDGGGGGADGKSFGGAQLVAALLRGNHDFAAGFGLMLAVGLGYGAVHVDDVCVAFLGVVAETAGLVDIVFQSHNLKILI